MANYFDVYHEGKIIVEQEESVALAVFNAEEYLTQKCVDGDLEFGDFDVELVEYTEDGDVTGVKIQEEITIENFLSDYEEHSIMYGNILGVRCGKRF